MNDDNVLSINVADSVGAEDIFNPPPSAPDLLERYVAPHDVVSREVTQEDVGRLIKEAEIMHKLCFTPRGKYPSALAIAHPQIDDQDPLRFFVTLTGEMIVNPVIKNTTKVTVDNKEGCMSYPDEDIKKRVQRYNVIDLDYQTILKNGDLSEVMTSTYSGKLAKIIQHEFDHLNAKYIFDKGEVVA